MFAGIGNFQQTSDRVSVVYHISVDNRHKSYNKKKEIIFADVHNISAIPTENEILFDLSSPFEVESIEYDAETTSRVWNIKMHSTNKAEELVNTFLLRKQYC